MLVEALPPDVAVFYRAQSAFSDPGGFADLYADLPADPADPAELARIVRGLMIHRLEGDLFGHEIAEERLRNDAETRYLDDILRLLVERSSAPLALRREPADRFVGVCRDFALLLCSFLRHAGVPARVRCGFADYFGSGDSHADHVVTEYWDPTSGWKLADAQLVDPIVADRHGVDFDPMDVPRDRFQVAGVAWRAIRAGTADPKTFGHVGPALSLVGEWFVTASVRLDLAAVNKVETLLWDVWGVGAGSDEDMTDAIRVLYDEVAEVVGDEVSFAAARALFTTRDGLRTPDSVLSLAPFNGPSQVALRG